MSIFVDKISQILLSNPTNQQILLPTLGIVVFLREYYYDIFKKSFFGLKNEWLSKIKEICVDYVPDLQEEISQYLNKLDAKN